MRREKRRKEERRKKKKREREEDKERDGRTWPCKQRGYAAAAPLLSSPLSPLSPRHIASVRSARSLTHSLRSLRRSRRSPSLSCRNPRPLSVPLSLYPVRCFPLFPFPRVHVRACTRVAASSSIGGRATQRAGYFSGWDI